MIVNKRIIPKTWEFRKQLINNRFHIYELHDTSFSKSKYNWMGEGREEKGKKTPKCLRILVVVAPTGNTN